MRATDHDILVIGGGIAGLGCAMALADRGLKPVVLEREPRLGGRASSWAHPPSGDVVDIGPHILHSEYLNFPAMLRRVGTADQVSWQPRKLITLATQPRVTELKHRPLPVPFALFPDLARAPGLQGRDLASNTRVTWKALRFREEDVASLDRHAALGFLREHGVTERMIDWFWRFASMAVMNVPLERCSTAALMRAHSQLIGHRGLHFGFPAIALGDLYAPGAKRIIEAAGGKVLTRASVVAVERAAEGHVATLEDGTRFTAARCVLAMPPQDLARLAPGLAPPIAFEPSPYRSVYLWFDRKVTRERFWALPWTPERLNYDFYDLSNIRPAMQGRDSVVASNVIYSHRAHAMSDAELVQATVREMALFAPEAAKARVIHADVHHVPMAICCPTPGTESARAQVRTRIPGLFLAGDWLRTELPSSMESAARSGFLAAEAILEELGRPERISIRPRANDGLARLVAALPRMARR